MSTFLSDTQFDRVEKAIFSVHDGFHTKKAAIRAEYDARMKALRAEVFPETNTTYPDLLGSTGSVRKAIANASTFTVAQIARLNLDVRAPLSKRGRKATDVGAMFAAIADSDEAATIASIVNDDDDLDADDE